MKLDVTYELGEYKFVWDSEKAIINKKKHKVSFETAARVFLDENLVDDIDDFHSDFEDRFKTFAGRYKLFGRTLHAA